MLGGGPRLGWSQLPTQPKQRGGRQGPELGLNGLMNERVAHHAQGRASRWPGRIAMVWMGVQAAWGFLPSLFFEVVIPTTGEKMVLGRNVNSRQLGREEDPSGEEAVSASSLGSFEDDAVKMIN